MSRLNPIIIQCDGCELFLGPDCRRVHFKADATLFASHRQANRLMSEARPRWYYDGVRRETDGGEVVLGTDLCPDCLDPKPTVMWKLYEHEERPESFHPGEYFKHGARFFRVTAKGRNWANAVEVDSETAEEITENTSRWHSTVAMMRRAERVGETGEAEAIVPTSYLGRHCEGCGHESRFLSTRCPECNAARKGGADE